MSLRRESEVDDEDEEDDEEDDEALEVVRVLGFSVEGSALMAS